MSAGANRLRLIEAFKGIRRLPVSVVGHSTGSTINIGFGVTTPRRYLKHRSGKRRPGYSNWAKRDLFLLSATWEVRRRGGYSLRWSDNPRRIAREIELLVGKTVIGIVLRGSRQPAEVRFAGGATLRLWFDHDEDDGGWIFSFRENYISASDLHS